MPCKNRVNYTESHSIKKLVIGSILNGFFRKNVQLRPKNAVILQCTDHTYMFMGLGFFRNSELCRVTSRVDSNRIGSKNVLNSTHLRKVKYRLSSTRVDRLGSLP